MEFENIMEPVKGTKAFSVNNQSGIFSRSALLLIVGILLNKEYEAARVDLLEEDKFPIFKLDVTNERFDNISIEKDLLHQYGKWVIDSYTLFKEDLYNKQDEIMAELVDDLYEHHSPLVAAKLILLGLFNKDELVRVSSAVSYLDIFNDIGLGMSVLLWSYFNSSSNLIREMAGIALQRKALPHSIYTHSQFKSPKSTGVTSSGLIIHGTFFKYVGGHIPTWWLKGGDFHTYVKNNLCSGLYSSTDSFTWSGGWSDHARYLAAQELNNWINTKGMSGLDIFAHSHGGNVSMRSTQLGLKVGKLVLLSCPVHWQYYQPDFSNVAEVHSIRINLDFTILTDRGGQRFSRYTNRIKERILPFWFIHHDDTHDPNVWQKYSIVL